jgi:LacI family repressor for deo operon, udp, cdd, tsx, nupC, and nupG
VPQAEASRTATGADVAARAGVSTATVSLVLTAKAGNRIPPETQQAVLRAAAALGYHPNMAARVLAGGRTRTIAYVVAHADVRDPIFAEQLLGADRVARAHGYAVMLLTGESGKGWQQEVTEALCSRRVDGAVLQSSVAFDIPDLSPFAGTMVSNLPSAHNPSVQLDEVGGMNAALDHLVGLGHRRIGYLCVTTPGARRLAAYVRGMHERGLEPLVQKVAGEEWTIAESFVAAHEMLLNRQPTAIVCFVDLYAAGVYKAAKLLGLRIGHDLSVVAYGDSPITGILEPELTTVKLPGEEVGATSVEILLAMLEDGQRLPSVQFPLPLTIRGSTGAAARPG